MSSIRRMERCGIVLSSSERSVSFSLFTLAFFIAQMRSGLGDIPRSGQADNIQISPKLTRKCRNCNQHSVLSLDHVEEKHALSEDLPVPGNPCRIHPRLQGCPISR